MVLRRRPRKSFAERERDENRENIRAYLSSIPDPEGCARFVHESGWSGHPDNEDIIEAAAAFSGDGRVHHHHHRSSSSTCASWRSRSRTTLSLRTGGSPDADEGSFFFSFVTASKLERGVHL
jgi:hypothetical protein